MWQTRLIFANYGGETMNTKTIIAISLAAVFAVSMIFASGTLQAYAAPPGIKGDATLGKMLFKFNILATPNGDWSADDTTCPNSGHRMFFERVSSGSIGTILWTYDPTATGIKITDCDGTSDGTGAVTADEKVNFVVAIRVHGKNTDSLTLTCLEVTNPTATIGENLCIIDGAQTIGKGKSFTKIGNNIFDNELEEILWTLETSTGFRNAEVRIYELIT
jgi:hypothetical protein